MTIISNGSAVIASYQYYVTKFITKIQLKIDLQNKFDLKGGLRTLPKLSFSPLVTSAIVRYISKVTNQGGLSGAK